MSGQLPAKKWIALVLCLALLAAYYLCLPEKLFTDPYSTVLLDRNGELLSAQIAPDGQWRFPDGPSIPEKLRSAIVLYEDKRFDEHFGVDPLAVGRAIKQNLKAGTILSGASTITMQVVRLSRKNPSRTFIEKFWEAVLATRIEWRYDKNEIINMYANHAPYGGNVVGIQAAAWRYFGRDMQSLSWAEACLLAVLPNNPSLMHPGKNRDQLKRKRDGLLQRLAARNIIDELTLALAMEEAIPEKPHVLPRQAHHLLIRAALEGQRSKSIRSSLVQTFQQRLEDIVAQHHHKLKGNQIFNAAALVAEVNSGQVLAYVGNTNAGAQHHDRVDVITAPRSTGSILKPLLYAAMLNEGKILQKTLVPDVPTLIDGFAPRNFSHEYDGAVQADQALIRSLNIPAVFELRDYRYEKFYSLLKQIGITTLDKSADHYGLSLILGGSEATLWDIAGAYASMARTLNNYFEYPGSARYPSNNVHPLSYREVDWPLQSVEHASIFSASSIWLTFDVLTELYRPGEESGWRLFDSSKKIAWKTGTSFGFRDGWAVGVDARHVVAVWVGNADGEGRPGLTGVETAAPLLFDIFNMLPGSTWFQKPESELIELRTCAISGMKASERCEKTVPQLSVGPGDETPPCTYHKRIHVSLDGQHRVNLACTSPQSLRSTTWFVLPPVQEYYYRSKNLSYQPLPSFAPGCSDPSQLSAMDMVYPKNGSEIFVPRDLDGSPGKALFEAVHRTNSSTLYWHLDGELVAETHRVHRLAVRPSMGSHTLTIVDQNGEQMATFFKVLSLP